MIDMEQWKEKSIRFPQKSDDKLRALVLKFGRSKKLFLVQMIDYFFRSKKILPMAVMSFTSGSYPTESVGYCPLLSSRKRICLSRIMYKSYGGDRK